MAYDGDGNRVAKTTGGVTTKYVVDDFTPTGYSQVAEEIVGGTVQRRYTHGTMRISQTSGGATSYYGYDAGGSVRTLADTTGVVTDTYTYDAFGNLVASTGTTPNVYLYRGEQFDPALGLYYLRARWMNPQTGRFMSRDPYEGDGALSCCKYQQFMKMSSVHHLYEYTHTDPANQIDPSGEIILVEHPLLAQLVVGTAAVVTAGFYGSQAHAGENLFTGIWSLMLKVAITVEYFAIKADLRRFRSAGSRVGREDGCRSPEPDDFDAAHDYLKSIKLGANDPNVTMEDILEAWRAILCP